MPVAPVQLRPPLGRLAASDLAAVDVQRATEPVFTQTTALRVLMPYLPLR